MEHKFKVGVSLRLGESPDEDENLQALAGSSMAHAELGYASYCDDPAWAASVREKLDASPVNINSVHALFSHAVDISRLDDGGQEHALEQVGRGIVMAERLGAGHGSAGTVADGSDLRAAGVEAEDDFGPGVFQHTFGNHQRSAPSFPGGCALLSRLEDELHSSG